ncbi:dihydroorotate dehydrogenase [Desulfobacterales bacterium HSG16]|nr:dihydroorotate dehydrogenase [Desulfobacterales bacterium HSG16]
MTEKKPVLTTDIGGLVLKNPVMTASGTFGYGKEFEPFMDLNQLGAVIVKGLSLKPAKGNPPPRIVETKCGMLNAIGLENIGIEKFVSEKLPFLRKLSCPAIANIYGTNTEEYVEIAGIINDVDDISGIELNISCPNVKVGGVAFGVDPVLTEEVVCAVRKKTTKPLMVKLSPNVTDITKIARVAEDSGADSISLINTITGMAIDINTRRPKIGNITGGLSGPAIKPVALRMVWQVAEAVKIPVIGIGGIMTAEDAIEFLIAGACAVQVGTANLVNPAACTEILQGIEDFCKTEKITSVDKLIGTLNI